jgi:hypothetical protein
VAFIKRWWEWARANRPELAIDIFIERVLDPLDLSGTESSELDEMISKALGLRPPPPEFVPGVLPEELEYERALKEMAEEAAKTVREALEKGIIKPSDVGLYLRSPKDVEELSRLRRQLKELKAELERLKAAPPAPRGVQYPPELINRLFESFRETILLELRREPTAGEVQQFNSLIERLQRYNVDPDAAFQEVSNLAQMKLREARMKEELDRLKARLEEEKRKASAAAEATPPPVKEPVTQKEVVVSRECYEIFSKLWNEIKRTAALEASVHILAARSGVGTEYLRQSLSYYYRNTMGKLGKLANDLIECECELRMGATHKDIEVSCRKEGKAGAG